MTAVRPSGRGLLHAARRFLPAGRPRAIRALVVLTALTALAGLSLKLLAAGPRRMPADALTAPPLPAVDARCDTDTQGAAGRAAELERAARARMARYPFAPDDGLRALRLLRAARDCRVLAGTADAQLEALDARAQHARARIEHDYRGHLAHLRRALAIHAPALARDDVRYLRAVLAGRDGSFSARLRALAEQLGEDPANHLSLAEPRP